MTTETQNINEANNAEGRSVRVDAIVGQDVDVLIKEVENQLKELNKFRESLIIKKMKDNNHNIPNKCYFCDNEPFYLYTYHPTIILNGERYRGYEKERDIYTCKHCKVSLIKNQLDRREITELIGIDPYELSIIKSDYSCGSNGHSY